MAAIHRWLSRALVLGWCCSVPLAARALDVLPRWPPTELTWVGTNLATSWSLGGNGLLEQFVGPDLATAYRATVSAPASSPWEVQLSSFLGTVPDGQRLRFRFWARASTGNWIRALVETDHDPWTMVDQAFLKLGADWQPYALEMVVPAGQEQPLAARLQLGGTPGVFEFAQVEVLDVGPDPALADAATALQPDAVRERIQRLRTGNLVVRVTNAEGAPVAGARVIVTMKKHAFLFGSNAFVGFFQPALPQLPEYQDRFAGLFNYATLPVYWSLFEPTAGAPQYTRLEGVADWAAAHGIATKAHPLVWHERYPDWAPADPAAAVPLLQERVQDLVTRERSRIRIYDVFNEATINWWWPLRDDHGQPLPRNGEQRWIERDGQPAAVEAALGWARAADGGATFVYNDDKTGAANLALLAQLQEDGALPDVIGIQSHMHEGMWPLERVWQVCERFSRFGKPIHFTELTVLSGPPRQNPFQEYGVVPATDWFSTAKGERMQADYVGQLYSVLFSHPSVHAITWWELSDLNAWLGAPAGLLRADMTPKPAYDRLVQLIHHDWWTDTSGASNAAGVFQTRAFHGEYVITVDALDGRRYRRTYSFPAGAARAEVVFALPPPGR